METYDDLVSGEESAGTARGKNLVRIEPTSRASQALNPWENAQSVQSVITLSTIKTLVGPRLLEK